MPNLLSGNRAALMLLLLGAGGLLVCVLLTSRLLIKDNDRSPTRRTIVHWVPIALMCIVCTVLRQPELAIGVIFGTSVAAISSVAGFIAVVAPVGPAPAMAQRVWPFLPVPALLASMIALAGSLGLVEAALLIMQGMLALLIWQTPADPGEAHLPIAAPPRFRIGADLLWTAAELALLAALGILAAWVATGGATGGDQQSTASALAATLISIVLVMPMISTGAVPALAGQGWVPITAQAGVVLANICVLLPAVILLHGGIRWIAHFSQPLPTSGPIWPALLFPRLTWRIDSIALVILSLPFVPLASGKLRLDYRVGGCLILAYCVYLMLLMYNGLRI